VRKIPKIVIALIGASFRNFLAFCVYVSNSLDASRCLRTSWNLAESPANYVFQ